MAKFHLQERMSCVVYTRWFSTLQRDSAVSDECLTSMISEDSDRELESRKSYSGLINT